MRPTIDYTEVDALLGTMPDQYVADATGLSRSTIRRRRQTLRIPPTLKPGGKWSITSDRGRRAYEIALENIEIDGYPDWWRVAHELGRSHRRLVSQDARLYARRHNLPWPLRGTS